MRDEAGDDEECGDSKRASSRSPRRRVEEGRRDDATTTKTTIASANADATALYVHTHTRSSILLADAGDDCSTRLCRSSHPLRHRDDGRRECAGPHHPPVASHGAPGGQVPESGRC